MENIYSIKNVRRAKGLISSVSSASWLGWLGTIVADPQGVFPGIFLATYFSTLVLNDLQTSRISKTVEYKRFTEIYDSILSNYVDLITKLDFKEVVEIYTLFTVCINSGMFSVENPGKTLDGVYERGLVGAKALNNHGVCRHIAKMLVDIFNRMNFEATVGVCAKYFYESSVFELTDVDKAFMRSMFEKLKNEVENPVLNDLSFDDLVFLPPFSIEEKEKPLRGLKKYLGNHAISLVNDDNNSYYLDSTCKGFLVPSPDNEREFQYLNGHRLVMTPLGQKLFGRDLDLLDIAQKPFLSEDNYMEKLTKAMDKTLQVKEEVYEFHETILEPLKEADAIYRLLLK